MPLSTGAEWPALRPNFTAAAEDMTAKFEWIQGHRLPMQDGDLTASAFDIGSAAYPWANGYIDRGYLGGTDLELSTGSIEGPMTVRAWAKINHAAGTATAYASFNVATVSAYLGGNGIVLVQLVPGMDTSTAFQNPVGAAIAINGGMTMCRYNGYDGNGIYEFHILQKGATLFPTFTASDFMVMILGD